MDLRQLRQFIAVAQERSFRGAAQRLHISQPPLSVAVRKLEEEVGTALLDRSKHHVRLTLAGEVFLKEASQVLAQARQAVEMAQRAAAGQLGALSVSFVPSAALGVVPRLLREFGRQYPGVKLTLSGDTTSQQLTSIVEGSTDVGIVVPPLQQTAGVVVEAFDRQEFVLAVPAGHPLASRRSCQIQELADEKFVGLPFQEGPGFSAAVISVCQECGFIPDFVHIAPQVHTVLVLVAGGLGVSLVPKALKSVAMETVRYIPLRHGRKPLYYSLGLAYRETNTNPSLALFIELAQRTRRRGRAGTTITTPGEPST